MTHATLHAPPVTDDGPLATSTTEQQRGFFRVESAEWPALLLSFAYFFCVLGSYYVMRPVREQLVAAAGSTSLPSFYLATFLVTLALTPIYGALVARFPRKRFVPIVYAFFILCLIAFIPFFELQGQLNPKVLGGVFFVWVSVFNLFVVAVFWSFMADIFTVDQSHRLFSVISIGGGLGAIGGSLLAGSLVGHIGIAKLLAVSAGLLGCSIACIAGLVVWSRRNPIEKGVDRNEVVIGGGMLAGARQVFASPFLRSMALLLLLGDGVGTVLYALQADYAKTHFPDGIARTEFFAHIDLAINITQTVLQLSLTPWVLTRSGPVIAVIAADAVKVAGLLLLVLVGNPALIAVALVATRSFAYGMEKPSSDSLYTRVDREERYKAKGFIDTAVWRLGDFTIALAMNGLRGLGVTTTGFACLATFAAGGACWTAWRLRGTRELAAHASR